MAERDAKNVAGGSFNQTQGTAPFVSQSDVLVAMACYLGRQGFALVDASRLQRLEALERDHLRGEQ